jgi:uncharacterized protein (DUF2147 family)
MKRFGYLAVLVVLSSSASTAQAGDSYSFLIGGHRIHIEARHGCRSLSCVSWSDSGARNRRDRNDDAAPAKPGVAAPAPAQPAPATVQAQPAPVQQAQVAPAPASQVREVQVAPPSPSAPAVSAPLVTKVSTETIAPPPAAPKTIELASTTTQSIPPSPKPEPKIVPLEKTATPSAPAKDKAKDEHEAADTPLGDWQTEGKKGLVRIEQCGKALCGYVLNESTDSKGETVLSNMKSNSDKKWTGDIFSRASGNSYYAKMTLKAPNTLHVEACAVLRFFCSGNDWTRVVNQPDEMVISRQSTREPNS